ncbi:hypothetical protein [Zhongshania sp.]|uniref:hypothetical protein n=1 Tax=Zhongshania sp. TaxID=1971902 RepID=UPI0035634FEA
MMSNTTALKVEHPGVIRNLLLTALLAVAVAVTPKQAHAEHAETAAAVLIGAAVLYAAHDAHKSDRKYAKRHAHVHDRHCGHHVEYRRNDHHRYGNAHVYYQNQYTRDRHSSYYGKHPKYIEHHHSGKHGKKYAKQYDKHDRYGRHDHKGKKYRHDDRHGNQSWNTRVRVSQGH